MRLHADCFVLLGGAIFFQLEDKGSFVIISVLINIFGLSATFRFSSTSNVKFELVHTIYCASPFNGKIVKMYYRKRQSDEHRC